MVPVATKPDTDPEPQLLQLCRHGGARHLTRVMRISFSHPQGTRYPAASR